MSGSIIFIQKQSFSNMIREIGSFIEAMFRKRSHTSVNSNDSDVATKYQ